MYPITLEVGERTSWITSLFQVVCQVYGHQITKLTRAPQSGCIPSVFNLKIWLKIWPMTWILMLCTRKLILFVLAFIKLLSMLCTTELSVICIWMANLVMICEEMINVEWSQGCWYGKIVKVQFWPWPLTYDLENK